MKIYKLKFETLEQAFEILESVKDLWACNPVQIPHDTNVLFDIILSEESEFLNEFEVFPTIIKHNFS